MSSEAPERPRRWLKWLAVALLAPGAILVVVVMFFLVRSELAHDEARCPFERVDSREVADGIAIVDEGRRCQDGVEEHRWVVVRDGSRREIGRRRLDQRLFDARAYSYAAEIERETGGVVVHVRNEGIAEQSFRERPRPDVSASE